MALRKHNARMSAQGMPEHAIREVRTADGASFNVNGLLPGPTIIKFFDIDAADTWLIGRSDALHLGHLLDGRFQRFGRFTPLLADGFFDMNTPSPSCVQRYIEVPLE